MWGRPKVGLCGPVAWCSCAGTRRRGTPSPKEQDASRPGGWPGPTMRRSTLVLDRAATAHPPNGGASAGSWSHTAGGGGTGRRGPGPPPRRGSAVPGWVWGTPRPAQKARSPSQKARSRARSSLTWGFAGDPAASTGVCPSGPAQLPSPRVYRGTPELGGRGSRDQPSLFPRGGELGVGLVVGRRVGRPCQGGGWRRVRDRTGGGVREWRGRSRVWRSVPVWRLVGLNWGFGGLVGVGGGVYGDRCGGWRLVWWFGCRVFGMGGAGSGVWCRDGCPGGGCTGVSVVWMMGGYLGIRGVGCGEGVSGPFVRGTFALKCGTAVPPLEVPPYPLGGSGVLPGRARCRERGHGP